MSGTEGRAWCFSDDIDTDVLAPGYAMKLPPEELAAHCLEAVDPEFASEVQPGDFVVAGRNFGLGSSREQAAISLGLLGVRAVLAKSFARIFYRNAFNVGLPALFFPEADGIAAGDRLRLDLAHGLVENRTHGTRFQVEPVPEHLMRIVEAGGLMAHLERKLAAQRGQVRA